MAAKNEMSAEAKIEVDEVDSDSSDSDEHESDGTSSDEDNAATKEEIQRLQTMVLSTYVMSDNKYNLVRCLFVVICGSQSVRSWMRKWPCMNN